MSLIIHTSYVILHIKETEISQQQSKGIKN